MVTLALIQMKCSENPSENLQKALDKIAEAARRGAQIVCLSELFLSRYFCQTNDDKFFSLAETIPGPLSKTLCKAALDHKIVLVASLFEKEGKNFYNTAIVINPDGTIAGKYRKIHIPDDLPNHYSELYYFKPGDLGLKPFETPFGKIGVLVCWDQWYPEAARSLALQGAQIIFYPTAIGWQGTQKNLEIGKKEFDAWITIQRSHAIANGIFIASVNRIGVEQKIDFWGGSFVADPYGTLISQASHDREEILLTTVDLSQIEEFRKDWPFLTCRRSEVYVK